MNILKPAALALALAFGTVSCTNGQIDPVKVVDAAKTACGIAIAVNSVVEIINAGVGLTVQAIVDLVCSAFKAQMTAKRAGVPAGTEIHFPVIVNGKTIDVDATVL